MNKRLFVIYTIVFLLIGLMLHLYRSSYNSMRIYIGDVHSISGMIIKLERLDALLHFWLNNDPQEYDNLDLYIPSNVAYDSILSNIDNLDRGIKSQEQRLRLDSLKRLVKKFQSIEEKSDTILSRHQREAYRTDIKRLTDNAFRFANEKLQNRKAGLSDATSLLDRWLVWMLVLAGSLITLATFYSFNFLYLRNKAESFNQTLLETTNNGIISFRPLHTDSEIIEYGITYCNDAAMKLLKISSWKSRTLSSILPKGILSDVRNAFAEVIQNRTSKTIEGYMEIKRERNWVQASIAPLEDGVLVSMYNLNPVKSYEQKLTYKIKQLELANDELQQYAYVTSHDLQEPLRKIQMFSDIALNLKPEQQNNKNEYFRRIIGSASHMRDLIQTLLVFTRSTDKPSEFATVKMADVIDRVKAGLEVQIAERNAEVIIDDDLPVVDASEVHMTLLFNNILLNSLKYSKPDTSPVIYVRATTAAAGDYDHFPALDPMVRYTRISVEDNGVGFQQFLSEKMFTIFQRLHNKENTPGNGIGLAICRKIVHQHHGFIYAEGKENVGATFFIFLPFEQPRDAD